MLRASIFCRQDSYIFSGSSLKPRLSRQVPARLIPAGVSAFSLPAPPQAQTSIAQNIAQASSRGPEEAKFMSATSSLFDPARACAGV
jgi:hypothetical protein